MENVRHARPPPRNPRKPRFSVRLGWTITKIKYMYSFQFQAHPKKPCSQHNHTNAVYKPNFIQVLQPSVSSTECTTFQHKGNIIISFSPSASPTQTLLGNSCVDHWHSSYLFQIATRVSDQHI